MKTKTTMMIRDYRDYEGTKKIDTPSKMTTKTESKWTDWIDGGNVSKKPFGGPVVAPGEMILVLQMWSTDIFNGMEFEVKEWRTDMNGLGLPTELPKIDTGTGNQFVTAWELVDKKVANPDRTRVEVIIDGVDVKGTKNPDQPDLLFTVKETATRYGFGEAKKDVAHQSHYVTGGVEPIDLIRSLGILAPFCRANIIKYVSRYDLKDGLEDLEKAKVYLGWLIDEVGGE